MAAAAVAARDARGPGAPGPVELRVTVEPPWPFRLGGGSADGLMRRRGGALQRLLHLRREAVLAAVVQPAPDRVVFAARARTEAAAEEGIARMRFATGVDDDLRPFYDLFRRDPVIGPTVRRLPHLRVRRRPVPWEALAGALTEQLIEFERALAIQRRLIAALGPRCAATGLRDYPAPAAVAAAAPARLAALDLAPGRAVALRRAAREVAAGRADLDGAMGAPGATGRAEAVARRLRAIPGVGPWTVEILALYGLGRHDVVAGGDLGYLKMVGRLLTGRPYARAQEHEVRAFFEPYGAWKGLAGEYLRWGWARGLVPAQVSRRAPRRPDPAPRRAGTRSSAPPPRSAAA
jgi:3-methyladenine DNA glycosylase/8-oxoguanine DNA glycosylase